MEKPVKSSRVLLAICFLIFSFQNILAEGTKELMPGATDHGYLQIFDLNTLTRPFASFNAPEPHRLHIHICHPGEKVFMGFRQNNNDVFFRVKDPTGTIIPLPGMTASGAANTYRVPNAGLGYIPTHAAAVAGPLQIAGAGGYNAIEFTPTMTGDYYVEFNPTSATVINPTKRLFTFFDITVTDASNNVKLGRLWSKSWDFSTNGGPNRFVAKMYVYAKDSIITSIDFNGIQPHGFTVAANSRGCTNTGNMFADRVSRIGNVTYPEYKIFLNNPDPECYPVGRFGELTQPPNISGCDNNSRCINVFTDKNGDVEIVLDLNGVPGYQQNTRDVIIIHSVTTGHNCIPWNTRDGLGNLVPANTTFPVSINYYNGLTHLPLYDVEDHPNGYIVELVAPAAGTRPKLFWDDSQITAGTALDGLVNLTGCDNGTSQGCHRFRNRGFNNCVPSCPETINTWWYANIIETELSYTVINVDVDAETRVTRTGPGLNDTTICASQTEYVLSGSVTGSPLGTWSNGSGTFSPTVNALNATYTPTDAEKTLGWVKLVLRSASAGGCPPLTDTLRINFQPVPNVNAGPDRGVCENSAVVNLAGVVNFAQGGQWQGGSGNFVPDRNTLNASYSPSPAELTAGNVTLTLVSTGNGLCNQVSDEMSITYNRSATANAGPDTSVCVNTPFIQLSGSVHLTTTGIWSGGSGTFSPDATTLNASYTPGGADAGLVVLTLTPTGSPCGGIPDQVTINFFNSPVVNAGPDFQICRGDSVRLNGSSSQPGNAIWTSSGTGVFIPSNNVLSVTYVPSEADEALVSLNFTLAVTASGCSPVSDNAVVTYRNSPVVNLGPDITACANNATRAISGSVSPGANVVWQGSGGSFIPNVNTLNITYVPSAAEVTSGLSMLVMNGYTGDGCDPGSDTLFILYNRAPEVNAGPDIERCSNNPQVVLQGTASNASNFLWSGGNGTYSPNATSLVVTYTPTAAEIAANNLTMTLTAFAPECNPVSDNVNIIFTAPPTVDAGPDRTICFNNPSVELIGSVNGAGGGQWSGGTGTFSPSASSLVVTYIPTAAELSTGPINLVLTSTNNGTCNPVNDAVAINITPAPTVNPGPDVNVCSNNPAAALSGSVTNATGGVWSGGAGVYSPSENQLTITYTPTTSEVSAGNVVLTLTTTGNGICNPESATVRINFTPPPTVDAGNGSSVCANTPGFGLNGTVTVATGGVWSGGSGIFTPGNTSLNASYRPSVGEIQAGSVTLTLTSTGNGNCNSVSDVVTFNIVPAPVVSAGPDQYVCGADASFVFNNAILENAQGVIWTTNGTGTFTPGPNVINATYNISAADKVAGTINFTVTTTGAAPCENISDQSVVTFTNVPFINAGPAQYVCTNDLPVRLNATGSPATWSGGGGSFSPNNSTMNAFYQPSAGEISSGSVTLTATTIPSGSCPSVSDNVTIFFPTGPTVNAGPDQTICGNNLRVPLNGSVQNTSGGFWSTNGTGTFVPNNTALNATYFPSSADTSAGSIIITLTSVGNDTCSLVSDQMRVTFLPLIRVNAGPDRTVCADIGGITLNATVANASGGSWTGGSGTYNPSNNSPSVTYIPTVAERAAGSLTFTYQIPASATCLAVSDEVTYTLTPAPTVNAGPDQTVCADIRSVTMAGTFTVSAGAVWTSSGSGYFAPDNISPTASYFPSPADTTTGSVVITYTTTGNGTCNPVSDQMTVTFNSVPRVITGPTQNICADVNSIVLNGQILNSTGGTWTSTGTGTFSPNANAVNVTYNPTSSDLSGGVLTFTLTSTATPVCASRFERVSVNIRPRPIVNAGPDLSACSSNPVVNLNGTIRNAGGVAWSTSGNGTFGSTTSLNTNYSITADDIAAGNVTITLTSTDHGTCNPVSDQLVLNIIPQPQVDAGPDIIVCADTLRLNVTGTSQNTLTTNWTSSGSGTFVPSRNNLAIHYQLSAADRSAGNITLTLTGTGFSPCGNVSDQMQINITPSVTVNAGPDRTLCADVTAVPLNAQLTVASGQVWSTSGSGTFTPDASALNPTYVPSDNDKNAGLVTLTLRTTGNGNCRPASDQMNISFTPVPVVNPGTDVTVCENITSIPLSGSVTIATGGVWATSGSGIFSPSSNNLSTNYLPSNADKAAGQIRISLTSTGNGLCNPVSDTITVFFRNLPAVNPMPDQSVCADANGVTITPSIANASGGVWSTAGSGTFAPGVNSTSVTYVPSAADRAAASVNLTFTTVGNGVCPPASAVVRINVQPLPVVNAGPDQTVCADAEEVRLEGVVQNASGAIWSYSGAGSVSPSNTTLTGAYAFTQSDIDNGQVVFVLTSTGNGLCNPVTDQMILRITPAPTVDAGPEMRVCADVTDVEINGVITVATGGEWTTFGSGTFSPSETSLATSYIPSNQDKTDGSVLLKLTTMGNGNCSFYEDTIRIIFDSSPVANAGPDKTVCVTDLPIRLEASGTTGTWSNGNGTFTPGPTAMNGTYMPTAAEITATSITLTFTSSTSGTCPITADDVTFTIIPGPTINAGSDIMACTNTSGVALNGNVSAGPPTWITTGTGNFLPNNATLNATYVPGVNDKINGEVTLYLASTSNGLCRQRRDTVVIRFENEPRVFAGFDQTACADVPLFNLSGSAQNYSSVNWSTTGNGSIGSSSNLAATYTPSGTERDNSSTVVLTLTANGLSVCNPVTSEVRLSMTPRPVVTVGPDQNVCVTVNRINLTGNVTVASGGTWETSGSGHFAPNNQAMNASYIPSSTDKTGTVTLTLTSTGNGTCQPVDRSLTVSFDQLPVVSAGNNDTICNSSNAGIPLTGTITHSTIDTWTTFGSGTFNPPSGSLNVTYSPSEQDKLNQAVSLMLTSLSNGACPPVSAYKSIIIKPDPLADAGPDQRLCITAQQVELKGMVENSSGGVWTTNGQGSFSPNNTTLNASYIPSGNDFINGVTLTLTTVADPVCGSHNDQLGLQFFAAPTANAGQDTIICSDVNTVPVRGIVTNSSHSVWTSSGSGTYTPSSNMLVSNYHPSATDVSAGIITLTLTAYLEDICPPATDQKQVTVIVKPTVIMPPAMQVCETAGSISVSSNITGATNISWSTTGNGTFLNGNTANPTYIPGTTDAAAGIVNLIVTASNASCEPVTGSFSIEFMKVPEVYAGPDRNLCADVRTVALQGEVVNSNGIIWSTLGTGQFSPGTINLATTYHPSTADTTSGSVRIVLAATSSYCPPARDTLTISFQSVPMTSATAQIMCDISAGADLQGQVINAQGGQWVSSGTGVFSPNEFALTVKYHPSAADLAAGQVTLSLTSTGNGLCQSHTSQVGLIVAPAPVANAGADQYICRNSSTQFLGLNSGYDGYQWTDLSGTVLANTQNLNLSSVGNDQTVVLTVRDNRGCFTRDTATVVVYDPPSFTLPPHFCYSDTLIIYAGPQNIPNVPGIFQWYQNGVLMFGQNRAFLSVPTAGNYSILFSYGNCTSSAPTQVTAPPVITSNNVVSCVNKPVSITATSNATNATYAWETGQSGTNLTTIVVVAPIDTTFYTVTVTDNRGCSSRDSVRLISVPTPRFVIKDSAFCANELATFVARPINITNIDSLPISYTWFKNGTPLNHTLESLTITENGSYSVLVKIGDCDTTLVSNVELKVVPRVTLPDQLKFCKEDNRPVTLDAGPGMTYIWSPVSDTTRIIQVNEPGMYHVTVINEFNCRNSDSVLIRDICPPRVFVPNALIPGHHTKGNLDIFGKYYTNFKILVFNRWGEVIFASSDPGATWDGTYRGEIMPVGVYNYLITYEGLDEQYRGPYQIKGDVTLVR
ncbi:MAG: gliding motility-associated C-terminal domain-containing protein [Cytophagaceae bacterium]